MRGLASSSLAFPLRVLVVGRPRDLYQILWDPAYLCADRTVCVALPKSVSDTFSDAMKIRLTQLHDPKRSSDYRPELDGIRAIAILAVLGFHVGFSDWSGGFLGVDVFFVLSGWLICGHIHDALRVGHFDPWAFFARRIRRLIPAAFACYLVVTLVVFALFLPFEQQAYLRYLLGSTFFFNNFVLMGEAGYFAPEAVLNPLLHTWSLSIEEQFYLVVPWLALLMGRNARAFATLLAVAVVVSLGLTLFSGQAIHSDEARYFSSLFRIWEIAAGGLAYVLARGRDLPRLPGVALAALLSVVVPFFVFDRTLLHPGPSVTVVVAGTLGLILFARPDRSVVGRMLASRSMAFVGRISYSTYLWHWPLIVFLGYVGHDFDDATRALVVLGSLGLGYISYSLIEAPFRRWDVPTRNEALFKGFAVQSVAILAIVGLTVVKNSDEEVGGMHELQSLLNGGVIGNDRWDDCWFNLDDPEACTLGEDKGDGRYILVWGDSMANSAVPAFDALARARGLKGFALVSPGCAPLKDVAYPFVAVADCIAMNDKAITHLQSHPASDIFLFARWPMYFLGYRNIDLNTVAEVDLVGRDLEPLDEDVFDLAEASLRSLLASIPERHKVFLVEPVPEHQMSVPDAMVRAIRFGDEVQTLSREVFEERTGEVRDHLVTITEEFNFVYVKTIDVFCRPDICPHEIDGVPIFADTVHLTSLGNKLLLQALEEAFLGQD